MNALTVSHLNTVGDGYFPDDEDRYVPQSIGLVTVKKRDAAASPRIFYSLSTYF
jgi:hypothetical protein